MQVNVRITRQPIGPQERSVAAAEGEAGAWVEFSGIVRAEEEGERIGAIEYEAYESMAIRMIRDFLERLDSRHPCQAVTVVHRVGVVPVGEAAIWVGIAAKHRKEAFSLLTEFMDQLKQDVPIWKIRALPPDGPRRSNS